MFRIKVVNKTTIVMLFVGASLFGFLSCHQSIIDGGFHPPEYFPNTVGDKWTYAVFDSIKNASDTVRVAIKGVVRTFLYVDTETVSLWEYKYHDHADTQYVKILHDTVNVYDGEVSHPYFIIPIEVDKKWGSSYGLGGDSTIVAMNDSIGVPAGNFKSGFLIRRHKYTVGPVSTEDTDSWIVPAVGSVWIHQKDDLGIYNWTWVFVNYEIPK